MQRAPNPRELREGTGATLRFRPPERWSSATGLVKDRGGDTIQSGAATVDPVDTTVAAYVDATEDTFKLADTTGVSRGVAYLVSDSTGSSVLVEVATVDPVTDLVTLVAPLPSVPTTGAQFRGVEVSFAVDAISDRDTDYRAVVRGTGQGQEETVRFDVAAQPWQDPLDASDVQQYISRRYPGELSAWGDERSANLAQRANDHVRRELRQADRYPSRYWDTDDLYECCDDAMVYLLAKKGLYPGNVDPTDHIRSLGFDLRDKIAGVIRTNVPYDPDGDDRITDTEAASVWHGELRR